MKIGVVIDYNYNSSGGYFYSLKIISILKKINLYNFYFIVIDKNIFNELKKENNKVFFFKKKKISNFYYNLNKIFFFKKIFEFLKIENPFVIFLKKKKIDLVFFTGPSLLVNSINYINFMINLLDINFLEENSFPEYSSNDIQLTKKSIYNKSTQFAFRIIVDTERQKKEILESHTCYKKKLTVIPNLTFLPEFYENNNIDVELVLKRLGLQKSDQFFFYPAQFWAHKNHRYIIDVVEYLKTVENINIKFIFCGNDKGNQDNIKNIIKQKTLDKNFIIFDYLKNDEIIALYKSTQALIMPTYVARSSLPLYESFYFQVPIFYSKSILDPELEKYVTVFDLNNIIDLSQKLVDFLKNKDFFQKKTLIAKEYYINNLSDKIISNSYIKILNDYEYLSKRWKN